MRVNLCYLSEELFVIHDVIQFGRQKEAVGRGRKAPPFETANRWHDLLPPAIQCYPRRFHQGFPLPSSKLQKDIYISGIVCVTPPWNPFRVPCPRPRLFYPNPLRRKTDPHIQTALGSPYKAGLNQALGSTVMNIVDFDLSLLSACSCTAKYPCTVFFNQRFAVLLELNAG